jgi:hypothetical protein
MTATYLNYEALRTAFPTIDMMMVKIKISYKKSKKRKQENLKKQQIRFFELVVGCL